MTGSSSTATSTSPSTSTSSTSSPSAAGGSRRTTPVRPARITVLYDANCPVCRKARNWVERQRQLVPLEFVAAGSPLAAQRFPALDVRSTLTDVTVITDRGAVLRGDNAWIAVLWSLDRTRSLAIKLAHGRSRWMFRNVKGATEAIRRLSADQPDRRPDDSGPDDWAPPRRQPVAGSPCDRCRT